MLITRTKPQAAETKRALARLAAAKTAMVALGEEDLLDFADLVAAGEPTPLRALSEAEMRQRNLSL